jgi:hypothetical protein
MAHHRQSGIVQGDKAWWFIIADEQTANVSQPTSRVDHGIACGFIYCCAMNEVTTVCVDLLC